MSGEKDADSETPNNTQTALGDWKVSVRIAVLIIVSLSTCDAIGQNWGQWRGPAGNNHSDSNATAPRKWSDESGLAWKTAIPGRGHSSPTVVGERVYLTTGDEAAGTQSLLILSRKSGELLKTVVVHQGGLPKKLLPNNTHANSTVACDGERIFALFLNDAPVLTALDLDGEKLWQERVCGPDPIHFEYGFGSSPILVDGLVIVAIEHHKKGSGIYALDPATGKQVWHAPRAMEHSYSTPGIARLDGANILLMCGNNSLAAYDAKTGKELWIREAPTLATCGTMVWDEHLGLAFASGGHPDQFTLAVNLRGEHDIAWQNNAKCYEQSLLTHHGFVYAVTDAGVAYCWKGSDGREMWKQRLSGKFSSSPLLVGDNIYVTNEAGETFVFEANSNKYVELSRNKLGDSGYATHVPLDGRLYYRFESDGQGYAAAIGE